MLFSDSLSRSKNVNTFSACNVLLAQSLLQDGDNVFFFVVGYILLVSKECDEESRAPFDVCLVRYRVVRAAAAEAREVKERRSTRLTPERTRMIVIDIWYWTCVGGEEEEEKGGGLST